MKNRTTLSNVLIALFILSIPIFTSPDFNKGLELFTVKPFLRNFTSYLLLTFFFFIHFYILIPVFYDKKEWLLYVISIGTSLLLVICLPLFLFSFDDVLTPPDFLEYPRNKEPNSRTILNFLNFSNGLVFQFLLIWLGSLFVKLESRVKEIQQEKLKAEVSYLKAKINPHFLFNTLNNIYALTLTKSNKASDAVLKLSDMMRYIVSESDTEKVSLEKELNYIKDFIELQKLRIGKQIDLKTNIKGNTAGKYISPIILINFIENAFKYGVSQEKVSSIVIDITIKNFMLTLFVKNDIVFNKETLKFITEEGVKNTKKRLQISYKNKHLLKINETKDTFEVKLDIDLS
ncbi:sensor histidine kinase [uncultured Polaribacter sp.]|uniref:sensor histidine kinase n=1 Tax=uncultured Polaribacter sp. TaxID=174711 RepID=UPI002612E8DA|nr:sensor histidine kinase [uncultured Polaribacter sp.]